MVCHPSSGLHFTSISMFSHSMTTCRISLHLSPCCDILFFLYILCAMVNSIQQFKRTISILTNFICLQATDADKEGTASVAMVMQIKPLIFGRCSRSGIRTEFYILHCQQKEQREGEVYSGSDTKGKGLE